MESLLDITLRSIAISFSAVLLAVLWSIPLSLAISRSRTKVSAVIVSIFTSLVGIPTVLIGLVLSTLLSSTGLLGFLNLLYTPYAIIIGQALLITPWLVSLSYDVFFNARNTYWELVISIGADYRTADLIMLRETLPEILVILLLVFSRAIGELGIALIVGGDIEGRTRVLTTAIAAAISKGDFTSAFYLGGILVLVLVSISLMVRLLKVYKE
ncbi:MAG: ABC transporter permease [Candidatus Korarchaeota archaeon]|nr:ABC transporter permease [Thermoproteota archaeon]MCR8463104.1 ABC transporter permease [Thermoproteota archaeon]MCR8471346.1 ABC transporter permease [Thermoproteota archaeon]MCR8472261.1 ABC transporter permease [Thermoproteota archaeon]MCR8473441.1 ABC transporter permease [Thermoproteota archaeon]